MTDYVVRDTQLTSVADAIRAKGGTSAPLAFPDGFVDAVEAIPTGGGPVSVPAKEVNFRDYDGTVVYSYTPAEFAALTAMPANPDHSGDEIPLTAQGWNWSFADAQAYVAKYGRLEVGQMYITTDGKTHIKIYIDPNTPANLMTFYLRWTQSVSNGVTVDWGDGSATHTYSGTSAANHDHTYAAGGWYDVTLDVTNGTISFEGSTGSGNSNRIYGAADNKHYYLRHRIREIYLGARLAAVALGAYSLNYCVLLKHITIPYGVTEIGEQSISSCFSLTCVTVPDGVITIGNNAFNSCYVLKQVCNPKSIVSVGNSAFSNIYSDDTCFAFPDNVTSVGNSALSARYNMLSIIIPDSVASFGTYAISGCYSLSQAHVYSTTPPTLADNKIFSGVSSDFVLYVPRGSLNAYKTATNWSAYASYMQEEPE